MRPLAGGRSPLRRVRLDAHVNGKRDSCRRYGGRHSLRRFDTMSSRDGPFMVKSEALCEPLVLFNMISPNYSCI